MENVGCAVLSGVPSVSIASILSSSLSLMISYAKGPLRLHYLGAVLDIVGPALGVTGPTGSSSMSLPLGRSRSLHISRFGRWWRLRLYRIKSSEFSSTLPLSWFPSPSPTPCAKSLSRRECRPRPLWIRQRLTTFMILSNCVRELASIFTNVKTMHLCYSASKIDPVRLRCA